MKLSEIHKDPEFLQIKQAYQYVAFKDAPGSAFTEPKNKGEAK